MSLCSCLGTGSGSDSKADWGIGTGVGALHQLGLVVRLTAMGIVVRRASITKWLSDKGKTMSEKTVTVTWVTLVEERYTAEIPLSEYQEMVNSGTYADDLASWEDEGSEDTAVTGREIEDVQGEF